MNSFVGAMIGASILGVLALVLIVADLTRKAHKRTSGRAFLACALGLGVLSVSVKTASLLLLERATHHMHVGASSAWRATGSVGPYNVETSYTAPWQALSPAEDGASDMERAVLGQRLFNERLLSFGGGVSCADCHDVVRGGDDGRPVSFGIQGREGVRNAPSVLNAALLSRQFWDGRATSLEAQVRGPVLNPMEMGMPDAAAVADALNSSPIYPAQFEAVFGGPDAVSFDNASAAIAAYERRLVRQSAYDRFVGGDVSVFSPSALRGMALFAGLGCRACHRDPSFSAAGLIEPAGVMKPFPIFVRSPYVERYSLLEDKGAAGTGANTGLWRVPSLRNVAETAPYFHNGSVHSLREAVRVMVAAQLGRRIEPNGVYEAAPGRWDARQRRITPLAPATVTEDDIRDLEAFLRTLSAPPARL